MTEKNRTLCSLFFKLAILLSVLAGLYLTLGSGRPGTAKMMLLFFTIQSNIWAAAAAAALGVVQLKNLSEGKPFLSGRLCLLQQVFTVSITLTGLIYCFVLVPVIIFAGSEQLSSFNPFGLPQILLHVLVPLLCITDFLCFTGNISFSKRDSLWALLPPLYYLIFSQIGRLLNWNFGMHRNYPYFFLNHDSPAGIFGFSREMPYFMGSFYWICLIALLVLGISYLYIRRINKKSAENKNKI